MNNYEWNYSGWFFFHPNTVRPCKDTRLVQDFLKT